MMGTMKKTILKASIISVLICSGLLLGSRSVMVAGEPVPRTAYYPGDTYTTLYRPTEIPPPNGTKQPIITITSPVNWSVTASNNLTLTFNLTLEASTSHYPITLDAVYYKPTWQPDNKSLEIDSKTPFMNRTFPFTVSIPNVPNGTHTITVYACAVCEYDTSRELVRQPVSQSGFIIGNFLYVYSNFYRATGSSSVAFTVDPSANEETIPPTEPPARGIPIIFLIAAGISIALTAAIVSLILYFKKRKR